ncbi:MAG: MBOAT family O-acyltransferase [Candidatus Auribacterota bacterium]
MLFNSLHFLLFFPIVTMLYFMMPYRFRWVFLLTASYYFYMCWKMEYIILIVVSTLIDYYAGVMMGKNEDKAKRRKYLILSLISNLGLLFAFKYFNFFNDSARAVFNHFNIAYHIPAFKFLLPVGISFYTFQTMSYSIDVYRGEKEPEKHLGIFALYVAFFPQLVAGPIERSTRLLPQFFVEHSFDYKRVTDGLKLMMWGFFKKLVIADRLAFLVNGPYNNPGDYSPTQLLIATYFFAFQIYCDFSGYSDIAIGSAQVLGFDLMDNFNRPYFSKSISEFWKRWHISLSSWFKDYLYIPLGGNRKGKARWYFNMFTVFLVSGLWHGANWTFVIWGALHGFYLMFSIFSYPFRALLHKLFLMKKFPGVHKYVQVFITFHLVLLSWIFFRANSVTDAFYIIRHIGDISVSDVISFAKGVQIEFIIAVCSIAFMEFVHLIQRHSRIRHMLAERPIYVRWAVYYAVIFGIIFFGKFTQQQFIYFQF